MKSIFKVKLLVLRCKGQSDVILWSVAVKCMGSIYINIYFSFHNCENEIGGHRDHDRITLQTIPTWQLSKAL